MGIFAGWAWETERDPHKDELWPQFQAARDNGDLDWSEHEGESIRQMYSRISDFMRHLHVSHSDQTIALVTHGGTINLILEHYQLKQAKEGFRMIPNASVLVLNKRDQKYELKEL